MTAKLPPRAIRYAVIALAAVLPVAGFLTTAFTTALAASNPLLLIALESPIRNLVLAHHVPLVPFLVVGTFRKTLGAMVYFFLGRWYGDAAIAQIERRAHGAGTVVRAAEYGMRKAAFPTIFLFPIPIVSMIAGSIKLRPVLFIAITAAGSLATAVAARLLGNAFTRPLASLVQFFSENMLVTTAMVVVVMTAAALWRWRRTRGRIETAAEMERELEHREEG